jgi:hypothetical protein
VVALFLFDEKNIAAAFSWKIQFELAAKNRLKAAPLAQSLLLAPAIKSSHISQGGCREAISLCKLHQFF